MTNDQWQQLGRDLAKLALDWVSDGGGAWDEDVGMTGGFVYDDNDERWLGREMVELLRRRIEP